ncbi:hypothetical protein [Nitrosomonas aestuarii]|uniref:Uncharacterized protein n=1 Tax=Nitrosomonas aestuarii TaxID=52441 RepID=A0A1I4CQ82_9PROT|nr:hypothetical protein [Nitrosomonas aestuarii]PTN11817.1 hypothetical protein C8R11_107102 [Nitrosomonas aestuarii]SFK83412.1 hypothetical protein SAMN05216302_10176 [Nitrosomonas aestuarii]
MPNISEALNSAIQEAVRREVANLSQQSVASEVEAAGKQLGITQPADNVRYVIYWTAAAPNLTNRQV